MGEANGGGVSISPVLEALVTSLVADTPPIIGAAERPLLMNIVAPRFLDAQLCYVEDGVAYFTTQALDKQWGDDWNDTPYEHNAGRPYDDHIAEHENREPAWVIESLRFSAGDLVEPREGHWNSPYCVLDINVEKQVPWLRGDKYTPNEGREIWAGTTLYEFFQLIADAGGKVYLPVEIK